nr:reverse transcriptase domain-containing protein [Tanacetum cinerariifolium]
MARKDAITMKMDAQYKDFQSRSKQSNLDDDDIPIDDEDDEPTPQPKPYKPKIPYPQRLRLEKMKAKYGKFLDMIRAVRINNKVQPKLGDPRSFVIPCNFNKAFSYNALAGLGASINPIIDVIDEIIEEDLDALPMKVVKSSISSNEPSLKKKSLLNSMNSCEILHFIEGTILEEKIFAEFDEFMVMTADENSEFESDTEEPPFKNITFYTDYKTKTSIEEPPADLELKPLLNNLEYVFLEEPSFFLVIISSQLFEENKNKLVSVLKRHKQAFV